MVQRYDGAVLTRVLGLNPMKSLTDFNFRE